MAHVEFLCCAVCDTEIAHTGPAAAAKDQICPPCTNRIYELTDEQHLLTSGAAVLRWIPTAPIEQLRAAGFRACPHPNPVDDAVRARGDDLHQSTNVTIASTP